MPREATLSRFVGGLGFAWALAGCGGDFTDDYDVDQLTLSLLFPFQTEPEPPPDSSWPRFYADGVAVFQNPRGDHLALGPRDEFVVENGAIEQLSSNGLDIAQTLDSDVTYAINGLGWAEVMPDDYALTVHLLRDGTDVVTAVIEVPDPLEPQAEDITVGEAVDFSWTPLDDAGESVINVGLYFDCTTDPDNLAAIAVDAASGAAELDFALLHWDPAYDDDCGMEGFTSRTSETSLTGFAEGSVALVEHTAEIERIEVLLAR